MVFERVCTDLEALGYSVQPIVIPAVAVGAPHRRDRVWFVANYAGTRKNSLATSDELGYATGEQDSNDSHANSRGHERIPERASSGPGSRSKRYAAHAPDSERKRSGKGARQDTESRIESEHAEFRRTDWLKNWVEVATALCRVDDGVPKRLDRTPRLKALGNAIVPQVAEEIMRAIAASA